MLSNRRRLSQRRVPGILALASGLIAWLPIAEAQIWRPQRTPNPDPFNDLLTSISVVSATDIWSVGQVAVHFDGIKWSAVPIVTAGDLGTFDLNGIAALSATDAWAVGEYGTNGIEHTIIEHWDGTSWSTVASPQFLNGGILTGMSAVSPQSIYACGWFVNDASTLILPFVVHWNGSSWIPLATPTPPSDTFSTRISALSDTDIWVVGYSLGQQFANRTFAMHFDGASWSIVTTPNVGGGDNKLSDVLAVAANDAWGVGSSNNGAEQTLIEHWNGSAWSVVPSPNMSPALGNRLFGIGKLSPTSVWTCGSFFDPDGSNNQSPLIEHWDGTQWTISTAAAFGASDTLFGVATISPSTVFLCGGAIFPPTIRTFVMKTIHGN
jgi:hypothetical protein